MLFKDTIKLVEYAEITASTAFASVKPTIQRIEDEHLVNILGTTLYKSLNDAYTAAANESALTTPQKDLLHKCRAVIGSYLGYYFAPIGEIKFSDAGVRRSETATEKTAFQYQVTNFREACLQNGDAASELLLEFLEEKKADYTDWENSEVFTRFRSLFIKSGKEFNQYFPSHSPYRNYWAMRSKMQDVEELQIRAAIGDTLYELLKTKSKEPTPVYTEKEKALLEKLKKAIANLTVSFAIPLLAVRLDANGITVATSAARTSRDADASRQNAGDTNMSNIIRTTNDTGRAWLDAAIKYLNNNAADFPGWETEKNNGGSAAFNNELKASFAAL